MKLDRLVNVLGGYGARLAVCPVPRSTELQSVAMRDPTDARALVGDVFLAVGSATAVDAVEAAAAAQARVVLVRGDDLPEKAREVAEDLRVAVLLVDPAITWSQLAGMVYGLVMEGRETASGRGPTDLFALADSLAEAVGGAVVIQDDTSCVLAYSSVGPDVDPVRAVTILSRRVPEEVRAIYARWGIYAHLAASDEPLFVPADAGAGFAGRMVVAARAGRDCLGSIWVEAGSEFDAPRLAALRDGARTVALHLLRSRASADLERHVESELVTWLLEGTADPETVTRQAGLTPGQFRVIAVRAHRGGERHAASLLAFQRATTGFGWSRPGRSALLGDTVYTILPGGALGPARGWVLAMRSALPVDVVLSAGIGGAAEPKELPAGRAEADEALALHERTADPAGAVAYDEAWFDILLARLRSAAHAGRRPVRTSLDALRRHDREHATHYVDTLRAWLEAQGDLVEAGQRLSVHPNTVRYRLRKMAEVTLLDLTSPAQRLALLVDLSASEA